MTVPVIEEYLAAAEGPGVAVTLITDVGTEADWWLLAVQSWNSARSASYMTAPTGTEGDWQHVGIVNAGLDAPNQRVWARKVASSGAQTITFPAVQIADADDNHCRVYVLSDVRAYQQFRFRDALSETVGTSHTAEQVYCPDADGLLVCVWMTHDATTNYTLPGTLTAQTELDGALSTSRSGHQSLAASGPTGTRIATSSVSQAWSAVTILISGSQGAITFPGRPLTFRLEHAFGADLTAHPDDWAWTDNTDHLMPRRGIRGRFGRADWASDVEPSELSYTLRNVDRDGTNPGRFSSRNPLSPYYGLLRINTPVRVWVNPGSGFAELFSGLVPSWPPYLSLSGADKTMPITAYGFSRLFQQGTPPTLSQWRRTILSHRADGLLAYWPCEDGTNATSAASALTDGQPMSVDGDIIFSSSLDAPTTNSVSQQYGSKLLPVFNDGGKLNGVVPQGTSSPVAWAVEFPAGNPSTFTATTIVLTQWYTPGGTYVRWRVQCTQPSGNTDVIATTPAGVDTTVLQITNQSFGLRWYRVDAIQDGTSIDIRFWRAGVLGDSDTVVTNTLGRVSLLRFNPNGAVIADDFGFPLVIGHGVVWDTNDPATDWVASSATDEYGQTTQPSVGWLNEAAHLRLARNTAEDGVLLSMPPVSESYVMRMDSQLPGTQLDLYRQAAATDGGVLTEQGFGLGYLPREWRYDPRVILTLSFSDVGREDATLQPVDDDREVRNVITVTRESGSSVTYEDKAGSSGSAAVTTYQREVRLNIAPEESLLNRAAREARLSTVEGYRYPVVPFSLTARPSLVAAWLDTRPGNGLTITDMPPDAPEDADLIVEGASYYTDGVQWSVDAACSPAAAWRMWTIAADGNQGRLDGSNVTLADPVDSDDVTLVITWPVGDRPPTEEAAQYPVHLEVIDPGYVAGEQVTATAATVTGAQEAELTVTRSVNGAVMSHVAGATVRLWRPSTLAL